jgi:hypothetical protein
MVTNKMQKQTEKVLKDCQVVWAFSNEQLIEGIKRENTPYINFMNGGFVPKKFHEKLMNFLTMQKATIF